MYIIFFLFELAAANNIPEFSYINQTTGLAEECLNKVTFCPQDTYTFTCRVTGTTLLWHVLNNGTAITGSSILFLVTSTDTEYFGNHFMFVPLASVIGNITSNAIVSTQNSITVEGDGLQCIDGDSGDKRDCEFTISKSK